MTSSHPDGAPSRRLVLMGQGYVGLPVAMRAVARGYSVVGFDVDEVRVKRLNAGESYVEDISDEVLQEALASGRYRATTRERDCAGFDVAVITVPTPLRDGVPDLSYIEASARTLGRYLRPGATVVLESTTYPGTTEELVQPMSRRPARPQTTKRARVPPGAAQPDDRPERIGTNGTSRSGTGCVTDRVASQSKT